DTRPLQLSGKSARLRTGRPRVRLSPGVRIGMWRSLVAHRSWGTGGRRFESGQPDERRGHPIGAGRRLENGLGADALWVQLPPSPRAASVLRLKFVRYIG